MKRQEVSLMKDALMEEYKNDLPRLMDERLGELTKILEEKSRGKLTTLEINSVIRTTNWYGNSPTYTAEEMSIVYESYLKFITEVNKKVTYLPTKQNYCGFAGITTYQYDNYLSLGNDNMREVMQRIEDYITDTSLSMAQAKAIDNVTTIFRAKTEHKYAEAQAPLVIEHKKNVDLDKIQAQISRIKANKSLKTIEIDPNDYTCE